MTNALRKRLQKIFCVEEFTGTSDAKSFEGTVKKALSRFHHDSFRVLQNPLAVLQGFFNFLWEAFHCKLRLGWQTLY